MPCIHRFDPQHGGRTPSSSTFTISDFFFALGNGISEKNANSDMWVDMYGGIDGTANYYVQDPSCNGDKCVAGYCYCAGGCEC